MESEVFWFVVVKGLKGKCIHKNYIQLASFNDVGDLRNYGLIPLIFMELRVSLNLEGFFGLKWDAMILITIIIVIIIIII